MKPPVFGIDAAPLLNYQSKHPGHDSSGAPLSFVGQGVYELWLENTCILQCYKKSLCCDIDEEQV